MSTTNYHKDEWYTRTTSSGLVTITFYPSNKEFRLTGYPNTKLNQEDILDFIDFCIEMLGHEFYMQLNQLIINAHYDLIEVVAGDA